MAEFRCPRCDYDLRGLASTWRDRCPLASVCSECGLLVEWSEVGLAALLCSGIAGLHVLLRRAFLEISLRGTTASPPTRRERLLDFVFYASFGVVVTSSVQMAGVLVVFSLLIVPAACAALFLISLRGRLLGAWGIGTLASAAGIAASAFWDLPTGASVIAALGVAFAVSLSASVILRA